MLALHLPNSRTETIACVPQIVSYAAKEKEWSTKENKSKFQ